MITERTPAERLADWKATHPDRLAIVDRLVRRQLGAPRNGVDATIAVHVEDILRAIFGVEP